MCSRRFANPILAGILLLYTNVCVAITDTKVHGRVDAKVEGATAVLSIYGTPYSSRTNENNYDRIVIEQPLRNGKFQFDNLQISRPTYISLEIYDGNTPNFGTTLYLIEPSDSIHVIYRKDTTLFEGRGAEKFICQYLLETTPEAGWSEEDMQLQLTQGYKYFDKVADLADSTFKLKLATLLGFKKSITESVFRQLRTDLEWGAQFKKHWVFSIIILGKVGRATFQEHLRYYRDHLLPQANDTIYEQEKLSSPVFPDFLALKVRNDLIVTLNSDDSSYVHEPNFIEMFNYAMKLNYKDEMKHKLVVDLFRRYYTGSVSEQPLLDQTIAAVKDKHLQKILVGVKRAKNKGMAAYHFALPDTTGRLVRLSDFKGSVMVLDFWYTGCGNCITLEEKMKIVRDLVKDDRAIKFVSISVDKQKSTWKKSVREGRYAGKGVLNLFTDGLGINHPLLAFYGIESFPRLIIIDKGQKVYAADPPRPYDLSSAEKFANMIKSL